VKEMLLVGRGGEGVVLASQILAETFARAGFWVQSFPEFKAERRGAPISAFLRWDETSRIHRRYKVQECDVLVVVSPAPPSPEILGTVRPGGLIVLNREPRFPHTGPFDIARVPASRIALENDILSSEGRPMGNVAVLGACVRLLVPDGLAFLEEAVAARMSGAMADANVVAAREGYAQCAKQHAVAGDTPVELSPGPEHASARRRSRPLFAVSTTDSRGNHTGTWSLDRPVLTDECTACAVCALFCPEGVISKNDGSMVVDYLYCKGCGICEVVCPVRNAIAMEPVSA
jgi:pyruvate ferredoxin oxidoreductase gamma subunit